MAKIRILKEDVLKLLNICKLGVDGRLADQPINLSETAFPLGVVHGLGEWCYFNLKQNQVNVFHESFLLWKQRYLMTSIRNQQKAKIYSEVQDLLGAHQISVLALKGLALSQLVYEDDGLRPMGDIDILVPDGRGLEALHILLEAGAEAMYEPRSAIHEQVHAHVRAIRYKGVMVEIHQRLFHLGSAFNITIDFESSITRPTNQKISTLKNDLFVYHLLAHAAYNYKMGGVRLSWLLDIALILKQNEQPIAFVQNVLQVNKRVEKNLLEVLQMVAVIMPELYQLSGVAEDDKEKVIENIYRGVIIRSLSRKHQIINLSDIAHTPGILRKIKLFYREFFPEANYMRSQYNSSDSLFKLYLNRIIYSRTK